MVSLLALLKHCAAGWAPGTAVVFLDSDVLIQRNASELLEVMRETGILSSEYQPGKRHRVVYSTELYNTMNREADEPMQARRDKFSRERYGGGGNAKKFPYAYPNSGLFMGLPTDLMAWLEELMGYRYERWLAAPRDTTPWDEVHRARGDDAIQLPKIYKQNDQRSVLDVLFRAEVEGASATGLDYEVAAFQSMCVGGSTSGQAPD